MVVFRTHLFLWGHSSSNAGGRREIPDRRQILVRTVSVSYCFASRYLLNGRTRVFLSARPYPQLHFEDRQTFWFFKVKMFGNEDMALVCAWRKLVFESAIWKSVEQKNQGFSVRKALSTGFSKLNCLEMKPFCLHGEKVGFWKRNMKIKPGHFV